MHHILARECTHNPRTDIVSSSVIHEYGAPAEAYAKALMTLTPEMPESLTGEALQYVCTYVCRRNRMYFPMRYSRGKTYPNHY
jgi:thiamine biosynthesis lipoprotein ApbE